MNQKQFSVIARAKSVTHAWRGVKLFVKTTHNAWLHIGAASIIIVCGLLIKVSQFEWIALVFAIGLVLVAEAFNTAIEIDMDLTSPQTHPLAGDTKDVAAGAVLIASIIAAVVGVLVFAPHIFVLSLW
jgi:diacylglycerol kinase (ATP)